MKAFALTVADQPASLSDLPDPELAANGALVRVHTASVTLADAPAALASFSAGTRGKNVLTIA